MSDDLKMGLGWGPITSETAAFLSRIEADLADAPKPYDFPVEIVRQSRAEGKGVLPIGGPLPGSTWHSIPGAPGGPGRMRVSEPDGAPVGIFLHIHGGGWTLGQADHYDRSNQQIAAATGMRVVSVAYRLAPEHPWPAQREDCMAAARWIMAETDLPVVVGGESAGGHLAAVTALGLRDEGFSDRLKGMVLNYGVFDLRMTPSARNWGERYLILSTRIMDWFFDFVDPGALHRGGAELSPLLADLSGLPPALVQVGTADPLLDDSLFMAARLRAADSSVELAVYPGGIHAFDTFDDLSIAREFRDRQIAFAKACVG